MATANFRIWRGDGETGDFENYSTEIDEGMVVLDAVHQIQAESAPGPSRSAGIARPASAAPVPPRSTATRS